jgi:hypothetical protein
MPTGSEVKRTRGWLLCLVRGNRTAAVKLDCLWIRFTGSIGGASYDHTCATLAMALQRSDGGYVVSFS